MNGIYKLIVSGIDGNGWILTDSVSEKRSA